MAGLHGGRHGHVAHYPAAMDEVARQVRNAVAPFMAGLSVNVTIEDLSTSDVCVGDTPRPSAPPARPGWIARVIPRRPQHESRTT